MSKWFGMGMRSAVASFGPVAVAPFRVTSYVDHDFAGLPDDAPVQKHAIGTVVVDVDPETGKIKRCTAVPHDQLLRRWNTVLVYWLQEQKEKAQQKEAQ